MKIPPFVRMILKRLREAGHDAYIVGGAVRDYLLGRPVTDWDVATSAPAGEIESIFADIRRFSLGHDTMTLVNRGRHYEVSVFRGPDGFGRTIEEDLGHRDFTINAMAYDEEKRRIVDPYGGQGDLSLRAIRAVRNPRDRFREDPLRLLRAVRIAVDLKFRIEGGTMQVLPEMAGLVQSVAKERIRDELMRILMCETPSRGFHLMKRGGLLKEVLPELLEGYRRRQNHHHKYTIYRHIMETVDRVAPDPVLRLTALLHDIAKPRVREKRGGEYRFLGHEESGARLAEKIMERLKFGREVRQQVSLQIENHMAAVNYGSGWGDGAVRRLIMRVGHENIARFFAFRRADLSAHGTEEEKLDLLSELERRAEKLMRGSPVLAVKDLAVDGHTVMEMLGLGPGPEVGRVLRLLMDKVIDRPGLNTEQALRTLLTEMKTGSKVRDL